MTTKTRWQDAKDAQGEIIKAIGTQGQRDLMALTLAILNDPWGGPGRVEEARGLEQLLSNVAETLGDARTYWISDDMSALARIAGRQLEKRDEPCPAPRSEIGFDGSGFILLESPMQFDLFEQDERVSIAALSWTFWNWSESFESQRADVHEVESIPDPEEVQGSGVNLIQLYGWARHGLGREDRHWTPWVEVRWHQGEPLSAAEVRVAGKEAAFTPAFIYSTISLMNNRVANTTTRNLDRAARRRAQAAGIEDVATTRCVTLRREEVDARGVLEQGSVDWSHRWMVEGHWRNQWYPSLGEHHPLYIAPHIKGPADKPFVPKEVTYAWTR